MGNQCNVYAIVEDVTINDGVNEEDVITGIAYRALRRIEVDEELFVSYLADGAPLPNSISGLNRDSDAVPK
ncbi:hypothetical protein P9112_009932 [Eukaryota sp. TZLM1-RC]